MATAKKQWTAETALATPLIQGVDLTATEIYSADADMESGGYEGAQVEIEVFFPSGANQNLKYKVYSSLNATYTGQEVAIYGGEIDYVANATILYPFIVTDVPHFRLGFMAATTASEPVLETAKCKMWNWEITA